MIGLYGHHFASNVADYLTVDGEAPDLGYIQGGYLFLASEEGAAILRENHEEQARCGADIGLIGPDELARRFPWMNVDGVALASHTNSGEGWLDPNALMQAFKRKARSLGVVYEAATVTGIDVKGSQVTSVGLDDGRQIACGTLVNAAGAQAGRLTALAGLTLPVEPRKRIIYVIDCREQLTPRPPLTINSNGAFFRPEGSQYLCGISPPEDQDPISDDLEIDYNWFEDIVWPTIAHRVPAFEAVKQTRAWAGHYAYNTFDQNGIVGRHPEVENLIFANGFSGHGLQQSPAVGRAVMELIAHDGFRAIDLARFGYERIAEGRPLMERNIV